MIFPSKDISDAAGFASFRRPCIFCFLLAAIVLAGCSRGAPSDTRLVPGPQGTILFDSNLWRAARETMDFLPPGPCDPAAGTLETGWGEPRGGTGRDRYRVEVKLDYGQAYDSAVAVIVRHQVASGATWREVEPDAVTAAQLARAIAGEAGELRLAENRH